MLIEELLFEKVIRTEVLNKDVLIHVNPTRTAFIQMMRNSVWKNGRGLIDGDDVYWWDAYFGTHHDVGKILGIVDTTSKRLFSFLENLSDKNSRIIISVNNEHQHHKQVDRLAIDKENIILTVE